MDRIGVGGGDGSMSASWAGSCLEDRDAIRARRWDGHVWTSTGEILARERSLRKLVKPLELEGAHDARHSPTHADRPSPTPSARASSVPGRPSVTCEPRHAPISPTEISVSHFRPDMPRRASCRPACMLVAEYAGWLSEKLTRRGPSV